jgi:hypothetical protein
MPDLALVDDRLLVAEEVLDRILDGQDVAGAVAVAVIEHRGDGRRLAGTGGADDQDQAALLHDQVGQHRRQLERIELGNVAEDEADDDADRAALAEDVDAEVADIRHAEGEVHLHRRLEGLDLIRRHQFEGDLFDHVRQHHLLVDRHGVALDLDVDRRAGGNENIRGLLFRHQLEQFVEDHSGPPVSLGFDQARSSSLMLVLARVCASTFLTITAQ